MNTKPNQDAYLKRAIEFVASHEKDFPEWSDEQRRGFARDAIWGVLNRIREHWNMSPAETENADQEQWTHYLWLALFVVAGVSREKTITGLAEKIRSRDLRRRHPHYNDDYFMRELWSEAGGLMCNGRFPIRYDQLFKESSDN